MSHFIKRSMFFLLNEALLCISLFILLFVFIYFTFIVVSHFMMLYFVDLGCWNRKVYIIL